MSCFCGDTHCPSCGPAQGNTQCVICHAWADDGCDHIDENGDVKPEFVEAAERARVEEEARWAPDPSEQDHAFVADTDPAFRHYCAICGGSETDHTRP